MTSVSRQVSVRAPWETAFAVFTEPERFPEFMRSVDGVRRDSTDPDLVHWQLSVASVPRSFSTRIDVDRARRTVSWHAESGLRQHGSAEFVPRGPDATEVRFALEFEPEGLLERTGDALGLVGARIRADVDGYVRYVESAGERADGHGPVATALDLDDPAKTPSERLTRRLSR
jgi:uncharacterized membrane protein